MLHSAEFVFIAVYGPSEDATDGEKDDFYVYIRDISRKIRSEQKLIITGDLNDNCEKRNKL
jgi:exonuclease III